MDPLEFDWNQMDKQRIYKLHPRLEYLTNIVFNTLFSVGFLLTLILALALPSLLHSLALSIYLLILIARLFLPAQRLWGRVYLIGNNKLVSGLLLELVLPELNVVVSRAKTGERGRFFLKSQPGKYLLNIYSSTSSDRKLLGQFQVEVGKKGVVDGGFGIIEK